MAFHESVDVIVLCLLQKMCLLRLNACKCCCHFGSEMCASQSDCKCVVYAVAHSRTNENMTALEYMMTQVHLADELEQSDSIERLSSMFTVVAVR